MKYHSEKAVVCIFGQGYVGLPLAEAFSKSLKVIGFDISSDKLHDLKEMQNESPTLIDVCSIFDAEEANNAGFHYRTL